MNLASIIHNNSTQLPPKFHKISPISSPSTSPKWVHFQLAHLRSCLNLCRLDNLNLRCRGSRPTSLSCMFGACIFGCKCRGRRYSAVVSCLRKSEQGEELSNAEETKSSQSHNGTNDIKMSYNTFAVYAAEERTQGSRTYVSSVRTVALCVFSAVAFGVGVGLTDGVSKSSEFFAGGVASEELIRGQPRTMFYLGVINCARYLLEQSLSVDNLFVFVLIFKYFKVPLMYQNRVLSYGIAGAIIFRLSIILLGTATLQRFEAVNLLLAGILLYSSFKVSSERCGPKGCWSADMSYAPVGLVSEETCSEEETLERWKVLPDIEGTAVGLDLKADGKREQEDMLFTGEEEDADLSDNFIVKTCQKFIPITSEYDGDKFITLQDGVRKATPLLLTVAVIELSDIAFAVDSIPAVFGVTRDPFIVFTSNLFAILGDQPSSSYAGLRSLYTLISESMGELEYLQPSIGVVLGFIGFKMILDFFGYHVSTEASLGVVATCLSTGVLLSLVKKSDQ
ncbi:hypothetical protein MTR67_045449 [Solanum verrucosum]|uniref:Thylakoid membrane protein TERC, chloroplastic n=1 Tax=Solanum verrucosum TaxID=315347 RepID=A0AAF0UVA1_SOLVR|nr:hypothetical protein MTR67_045449 [Solanum verrucosum]